MLTPSWDTMISERICFDTWMVHNGSHHRFYRSMSHSISEKSLVWWFRMQIITAYYQQHTKFRYALIQGEQVFEAPGHSSRDPSRWPTESAHSFAEKILRYLTIYLSASISLSKKTVGIFQWAVAHDFVKTHGDLGIPGVPSRCIARLACCSQLPRPSPRSEGVDSKSPPIGRPRSCNKPGMAHPQRNGKDVLLQCV